MKCNLRNNHFKCRRLKKRLNLLKRQVSPLNASKIILRINDYLGKLLSAEMR